MNFNFSDDQLLLRDTVGRLMLDEYRFEARREHMASPRGWSEAVWSRFAELGFHGLLVPTDYGGYGGGGVELMVVMEALGRALALEPLLSATLLPAKAIERGGSQRQRAELLPRLADGLLRAAFAHGEPGSRGHPSDVRCTAHFNGRGWLIKGHKRHVLHAEGADLLIASARISGGRFEPDGIRLFMLDPRSKGLRVESSTLQDGRRAASIEFDGVVVQPDALLATDISAMSVIEHVTEYGIAATVADTVGAMGALHEMTIEYLKTRVQFGRPIGSNQALQHKAVDMFVALEQARSMAILAAVALSGGEADARVRDLSMAKAYVGQLSRSLSQAAVQLHGGIAMTEEYAAGHYFRRILVNEQLFGDSDHHLRLLGDQIKWESNSPLRIDV